MAIYGVSMVSNERRERRAGGEMKRWHGTIEKDGGHRMAMVLVLLIGRGERRGMTLGIEVGGESDKF